MSKKAGMSLNKLAKMFRLPLALLKMDFYRLKRSKLFKDDNGIISYLYEDLCEGMIA